VSDFLRISKEIQINFPSEFASTYFIARGEHNQPTGNIFV
jgi:hypothetical protein